MDKGIALILQIALDTPLRREFDYLPPADTCCKVLSPGVRVLVPFGRRQLIGVLVGIAAESSLEPAKLKSALKILDQTPVFDAVTFDLLRWAADYYHHPLGEVMAAALPVALRAGQAADDMAEVWTVSDMGKEELASPSRRRAPQQRALLAWLAEHGRATSDEVAAAFKPAHLRTLAQRGWVSSTRMTPEPAPIDFHPSDVTLTEAQTLVVDAIHGALGRFSAHLLYGVTGSGKTEVYLRVIAAAIAGGGQALVLVPEIALTPQLVERFRRRFSAGVVVLHSALTGTERRDAWRSAHGGEARIAIGTRSAVFTSLPRLALIVVDEEHDASYKQHEGFRYSARDLAVWRAQRAQVPIILGSATPSLETLENVAQGRYSKHLLPQRPGAARAPQMALIDLRRHASEQGLSQPAMQAIGQHLTAGGQVLVFLNRRGYAPSLFCNACGWVAPCAHCDARMTLHRRAAQLRCHHCGACEPVPLICGSCGQPLNPVGQGTERVEETLARLFPQAPLARLDRDTAAGRGAMEAVLDRIQSGEARILVGTQMLTKGHHFPEVSLVVILDADQGLFASDFRATERLAQTITQVAGRAGRAARPGEVIIQTQFPDHPLLTRLIAEGYEGFAAGALEERREAAWPPYSRLALLRAEAKDRIGLDAFLCGAADRGRACDDGAVKILGPATALIARRADHFRAHLLLESAARSALQRFLARWLPQVEALPGPSGLRWSIDVDPLEVD
ncbi:MAG TPA: primosomal protein N' [Steroidobacteraceae bacterium]|nr:primosomal protein N' [Steroidobacteraceae bacterium]